MGLSVFALAVADATSQETAPRGTLDLETRVRDGDETGAATRRIRWDARKTAVVICDMWDRHWCEGATRRVADMAPRMNAVVGALRQRGVLIIHCPSGTLRHYEGSAARTLAESAPKIETRIPLRGWCSLDEKRESNLPIDEWRLWRSNEWLHKSILTRILVMERPGLQYGPSGARWGRTRSDVACRQNLFFL